MLLSRVRIYKNGDVGISLDTKCFGCGAKVWYASEILGNKIILKCLKCDAEARVTIIIGDMRAECVAREIVDDIKDVIENA